MEVRSVTPLGARLIAWAGVMLLAAGCAPFRPEVPPPVVAPDVGTLVARVAMAQVGAPYRYGGSDPRGFDCSGLVAYAYGQLGVSVPRTAAQQFTVAQPVPREQLRPGDLVFFRLEPGRSEVSHVGIYTGQGRFVHAPQAGRSVSEASLADEFYKEHYAGSGRLLPADQAAKYTAPR